MTPFCNRRVFLLAMSQANTSSMLPPNGMLFVACDVDPAFETDFNRWYDLSLIHI